MKLLRVGGWEKDRTDFYWVMLSIQFESFEISVTVNKVQNSLWIVFFSFLNFGKNVSRYIPENI